MDSSIHPPVKALTLDVGNTLIFPHPSLGAVYLAVAARHGLHLDGALVERRFEDAWRRTQAAQAGLIYGTTHEEALAFWYQVNRVVLGDAGLDDGRLRDLVDDLYATFGRAQAWRVNPGLEALLAASREHRLRVGIVSNWDLRLRPLLEDLGFTRWADPVVISAEAGREKPDRELFGRALRALGVVPEQVVHVGDTWHDDVLGAVGCGMQAAWLNPAGRPLPDAASRVHDLRRLEDAVRLFSQER